MGPGERKGRRSVSKWRTLRLEFDLLIMKIACLGIFVTMIFQHGSSDTD